MKCYKNLDRKIIYLHLVLNCSKILIQQNICYPKVKIGKYEFFLDRKSNTVRRIKYRDIIKELQRIFRLLIEETKILMEYHLKSFWKISKPSPIVFVPTRVHLETWWTNRAISSCPIFVMSWQATFISFEGSWPTAVFPRW